MISVLATVDASDEIAAWIWQVTVLCALSAIGLALAVLIGSMVCEVRRSWPLTLAGAALLLGGETLAFAYHVYTIDFVAVGKDGTKASGPLWEALLWPAMPSVIAVVASLIFMIRRARAGFLFQPDANEDRMRPPRRR